MTIVYFLARFIYLFKIRNSSIRFRFMKKKIMNIIGDKSANFRYYLINELLYLKPNFKEKI